MVVKVSHVDSVLTKKLEKVSYQVVPNGAGKTYMFYDRESALDTAVSLSKDLKKSVVVYVRCLYRTYSDCVSVNLPVVSDEVKEILYLVEYITPNKQVVYDYGV